MRARRFGKLGLVSALLAATFAAAAVAETMQTTVPYSKTATNTCRNEQALVNGTITTVSRFDVTPQGREHSITHVRIRGEGTVPLTSIRYVEMDITNDQANITPAGPDEFTAERTMHLTRVGEDGLPTGDDLRVHMIVHITMNANGTVTAEKMDTRTECR